MPAISSAGTPGRRRAAHDGRHLAGAVIDRLKASFKTVNAPVFTGAALIVLSFVLYGVALPGHAGQTFDAIHAFSTEYPGWFYILAASFFVGVVLWLLFSRYGSIRPGDVDERPEFSFFAWMAMFGGAALHLEHFTAGGAGIGQAVAEHETLAFCMTLQQLPLEFLFSLLATTLIATYFITSSDSGTRVVDALVSRGSRRSPTGSVPSGASPRARWRPPC